MPLQIAHPHRNAMCSLSEGPLRHIRNQRAGYLRPARNVPPVHHKTDRADVNVALRIEKGHRNHLVPGLHLRVRLRVEDEHVRAGLHLRVRLRVEDEHVREGLVLSEAEGSL